MQTVVLISPVGVCAALISGLFCTDVCIRRAVAVGTC